jgi:hypothetical protein
MDQRGGDKSTSRADVVGLSHIENDRIYIGKAVRVTRYAGAQVRLGPALFDQPRCVDPPDPVLVGGRHGGALLVLVLVRPRVGPWRAQRNRLSIGHYET